MSILAKTNKDPYTGFKSHYVNDVLWHERLSLINTTYTFSLLCLWGQHWICSLCTDPIQQVAGKKELSSTGVHPPLLWTPAPPPPLTEPGGLSCLLLAPWAHQRQHLSLRGKKEQFLLISFSKCLSLAYRDSSDFYIYIPVFVTVNSFILSSFLKGLHCLWIKHFYLFLSNFYAHHHLFFFFFLPYCMIGPSVRCQIETMKTDTFSPNFQS